MNAYSHRTWIPFYVVSFGALSMALIRSMDGVVLLFSLAMVTVALGIIFLTIQAEIAKNTEKKELAEALSKRILQAAALGKEMTK
ncbi:MAG TPA: hypothetical protein VEI51_05625 [Methanomicrobiales archaeon]|nr:hypothetical protein [Methanomicrobiales archaeon]